MLRKLLRKTPLAWLQVKREKTRLAVALAGIAFADVLMFVQPSSGKGSPVIIVLGLTGGECRSGF